MADDAQGRPKDAIERLLSVMQAVDLDIASSATAMGLYQARRERFSGDPTPKGRKAFYRATAELRKEERFAEELRKLKGRLMSALDRILSSYCKRDRGIWIAYFVDRRPIKEIADMVGLEERSVYRTVSRLKAGIIEYGRKKPGEENE